MKEKGNMVVERVNLEAFVGPIERFKSEGEGGGRG